MEKLQEDMNKDTFDASKEEEFDDSQGNVLARRDTMRNWRSRGCCRNMIGSTI